MSASAIRVYARQQSDKAGHCKLFAMETGEKAWPVSVYEFFQLYSHRGGGYADLPKVNKNLMKRKIVNE